MNPTLVIARAVDKMSLLTEIEHAIKRFKNDPTDHNEKEVALLFNLFMHKVAGERMGFDQAKSVDERVYPSQ